MTRFLKRTQVTMTLILQYSDTNTACSDTHHPSSDILSISFYRLFSNDPRIDLSAYWILKLLTRQIIFQTQADISATFLGFEIVNHRGELLYQHVVDVDVELEQGTRNYNSLDAQHRQASAEGDTSHTLSRQDVA